MISTTLSLALLVSSQTATAPAAPAASDHARRHPADSTYFFQSTDLAGLGVAYRDAPLVRLLRDEALLAFVREAGGVEIDADQVDPVAGFRMLLDQLPAAAIAMGVDEMLTDLRGVSFSATLDDTARSRFRDYFGHFLTGVELEQLADALRRQAAFAPEDSPSLERLAADDPGLTIDPWGRAYRLDLVPDFGHVLRGLGADGELGGEGLDADVSLALAQVEASVEPDPEAVSSMLDALGMQIVVEFGSEVTPGQIMQMIVAEAGGAAGEAEGVFVRDIEIDGVARQALQIAMEDEGVEIEFFLAQHGPTLVLGGFATTLERYLASLDEPTLDQDPLYRATVGKLPATSGTTVEARFGRESDLTIAFDLARDAIDAGALEVLGRTDPDVRDVVPLANFVAGMDVDRRPYAARTALADGRFVTHRFRLGATPPSTIFPAGPIAHGRFDRVGSDAALVMATDVNLTAVYDLLIEVAARATGVEPTELEAQVVQEMGADPRATLLPHLGSHLTVALDPIRGIGAPKLMGYLDLHDPERAAAGIEQLFTTVANLSGGALSAKNKPYRKMPLARLGITGFGYVEPTIGVVGDRLVLGLSGVHVKKELRRLDGGELEDHPLRDPAQVPLPAGATSVTWVDWGAMAGAAWDAARALAAIAGGFVDELPFDPEILPPGSLFSDHLPPSLRTVVPVVGGELTTTTKPFGPELWFLSNAVTVALRARTTAQAESEIETAVAAELEALGYTEGVEAETVDAGYEGTQLALIELRTGLEIFYLEHGGRYPATLAALTEPTENFPRGALDGQPVPIDGWGHPFVYAATRDGAGYELRSFGPDGVDQSGGGDDVTVDER